MLPPFRAQVWSAPSPGIELQRDNIVSDGLRHAHIRCDGRAEVRELFVHWGESGDRGIAGADTAWSRDASSPAVARPASGAGASPWPDGPATFSPAPGSHAGSAAAERSPTGGLPHGSAGLTGSSSLAPATGVDISLGPPIPLQLGSGCSKATGVFVSSGKLLLALTLSLEAGEAAESLQFVLADLDTREISGPVSYPTLSNRRNFAMCVVGGRILLAGGIDENDFQHGGSAPLAECYTVALIQGPRGVELNPDPEACAPSAPLNVALADATLATVRGRALLYGGRREDSGASEYLYEWAVRKHRGVRRRRDLRSLAHQNSASSLARQPADLGDEYPGDPPSDGPNDGLGDTLGEALADAPGDALGDAAGEPLGDSAGDSPSWRGGQQSRASWGAASTQSPGTREGRIARDGREAREWKVVCIVEQGERSQHCCTTFQDRYLLVAGGTTSRGLAERGGFFDAERGEWYPISFSPGEADVAGPRASLSETPLRAPPSGGSTTPTLTAPGTRPEDSPTPASASRRSASSSSSRGSPIAPRVLPCLFVDHDALFLLGGLTSPHTCARDCYVSLRLADQLTSYLRHIDKTKLDLKYINELERSRDKLYQRVRAAEARVGSLSSARKKFQERLLNKEKQCQALEAKAASLEASLEAGAEERRQRDAELKEVQATLKDLEAERTRNSEASSRAETLAEELASSRELLRQKDLDLDAARRELSGEKASRAEAAAKADSLERELSEARAREETSLVASQAATQQKLAAQQAQALLAERDSELSSLRETASRLSQAVIIWKEKLAAANRELALRPAASGAASSGDFDDAVAAAVAAKQEELRAQYEEKLTAELTKQRREQEERIAGEQAAVLARAGEKHALKLREMQQEHQAELSGLQNQLEQGQRSLQRDLELERGRSAAAEARASALAQEMDARLGSSLLELQEAQSAAHEASQREEEARRRIEQLEGALGTQKASLEAQIDELRQKAAEARETALAEAKAEHASAVAALTADLTAQITAELSDQHMQDVGDYERRIADLRRQLSEEAQRRTTESGALRERLQRAEATAQEAADSMATSRAVAASQTATLQHCILENRTLAAKLASLRKEVGESVAAEVLGLRSAVQELREDLEGLDRHSGGRDALAEFEAMQLDLQRIVSREVASETMFWQRKYSALQATATGLEQDLQRKTDELDTARRDARRAEEQFQARLAEAVAAAREEASKASSEATRRRCEEDFKRQLGPKMEALKASLEADTLGADRSSELAADLQRERQTVAALRTQLESARADLRARAAEGPGAASAGSDSELSQEVRRLRAELIRMKDERDLISDVSTTRQKTSVREIAGLTAKLDSMSQELARLRSDREQLISMLRESRDILAGEQVADPLLQARKIREELGNSRSLETAIQFMDHALGEVAAAGMVPARGEGSRHGTNGAPRGSASSSLAESELIGGGSHLPTPPAAQVLSEREALGGTKATHSPMEGVFFGGPRNPVTPTTPGFNYAASPRAPPPVNHGAHQRQERQERRFGLGGGTTAGMGAGVGVGLGAGLGAGASARELIGASGANGVPGAPGVSGRAAGPSAWPYVRK